MNSIQKVLTVFLGTCSFVAALASAAAAIPTAPPGFVVTTFASAPASAPPIVGPDDIAVLGSHVFVGWQNGVGTKGEANAETGQTSGTVIEYDHSGKALRSWNLEGKIDGLGADAANHQLIATVNEDGNSSLYTIDPRAPLGQPARHYSYQPAPDSGSSGGVFTGGGTDAVIVYGGQIYLSASAPLTESATALFHVSLDESTGVASLAPTFADNAFATDAVTGLTVQLGLTDPDSNASVPAASPRFKRQLVVSGQADQQLVFAQHITSTEPKLTRLALSHEGQPAGVDDVRWSDNTTGTLIVVDSGARTVYAVTGPFTAGEAFASLDTVGTEAQNTEVDTVDLSSGALTPFLTGLKKAKGLLWLRH